VQWPKHETSSTAFFCFAMAWGINNRILDSATFTPPMRKAWSGIVKNIAADGKLMYCQVVGTEPSNAMFDYYSSSEGEGALLLAGEELYKRVTGDGIVEVQCRKNSVERKSMGTVNHLVSGLSGRIALPAGVKGYEVYTAQGRKICQSSNMSGPGNTSVIVSRSGKRNGVYVIKFVQ
jgi:hypothetical protein